MNDALLTVEQLKELPAGAPLDAQVHEIIFALPWDEDRCGVCGWPIVPDGERGCWRDNCSMRPPPAVRADTVPPYSTDYGAAMRVVRYMAQQGFQVSLESEYVAKDWEKWHASFDGDGYGYDEGVPLPEAICHAALEAICDALANASDDTGNSL